FNGCGKNIIDQVIPLDPGETRATVSTYGAFSSGGTQAKDNSSSSTYSVRAVIKAEDGVTDSIVFNFDFTKKAAPYTVDFSDAASQMNYCVTVSSGCINYRVSSSTSGSSGTLHVSSITAGDNIQGTF